jgi:hypothetical protein
VGGISLFAQSQLVFQKSFAISALCKFLGTRVVKNFVRRLLYRTTESNKLIAAENCR